MSSESPTKKGKTSVWLFCKPNNPKTDNCGSLLFNLEENLVR